jgi:hypothetical protein
VLARSIDLPRGAPCSTYGRPRLLERHVGEGMGECQFSDEGRVGGSLAELTIKTAHHVSEEAGVGGERAHLEPSG